MSEYIITDEQLDALFTWIDELLPIESKRPESANLYKRLEVPRIVRCRDCKYYTDDEVEYRHYCNEWCGQVKPDGFCAWGERRQP